MRSDSETGPLRVEHALRFLPKIASVEPLRALLVASSRPQIHDAWVREPCGTIDKRVVDVSELQARLAPAIQRMSERIASIYEAGVAAVEAGQRGELAAAVHALIRAGAIEERAGELAQARSWHQIALEIAATLRDRGPEIEALRRVGAVQLAAGDLEGAARSFQRSLALAEAELDAGGMALACRGLGEVSAARSHWAGAESWFSKGLTHAGADRPLAARFTLELGRAAAARGQLGDASERLKHARELFASIPDEAGLIRVLHDEAVLAALEGRADEARGRHLEALERLRAGSGDVELELEIRRSLAGLLRSLGRVPDAEDQLRRAEELAIANDRPQQLARVYVMLGELRAVRGDEDGFVFFEKALELCDGFESARRLTAEIWTAYARFRMAFGEPDEARAYLERARMLIDPGGDVHAAAQVEEALRSLSRP